MGGLNSFDVNWRGMSGARIIAGSSLVVMGAKLLPCSSRGATSMFKHVLQAYRESQFVLARATSNTVVYRPWSFEE